MNESIGSLDDPDFGVLSDPLDAIESVTARPLPSGYPAEAGIFARQEGIPGHLQHMLEEARIGLVGAGGLNSWIALGLVRSGARSIVILDHDVVDRSNCARQLYYARDIGAYKAVRLARNLAPHAVGGAAILGIPAGFEEAVERMALPCDVLVVGVDNNRCRHAAVRYARRRRIPAVFVMLSRDAMRCHTFLQGSDPTDPCLWCAVPDLDPNRAMPCAASIIHACFLASASALFFVHRALMGWPKNMEPFNWRAFDLGGISPDQVGRVAKRMDCAVCRGT